MEYHYTRMYINSIAVQALVERASHASSGDRWLEQDLLRQGCAQDLGFVNNVRESSGQILVITKKLSDEGILKYFPVRFFLRVVSASIFLLKTICLGSKGNDARIALDQLEDAIQALMRKDSDDIHLSSRYAELIARHVRKLKRKLHAERGSRGPATEAATPKPTTSTVDIDTTADHVHANAQKTSSISQEPGLAGSTSGVASATDIVGTAIDADVWADTFWDEMMIRPLNPLMAPFGIEPVQTTAGLTSDSLDFLWSSSL